VKNCLKIRLLKQNDLCVYFDESYLAKLVEYCKEISLTPKEVLFNGFGVLNYQNFMLAMTKYCMKITR